MQSPLELKSWPVFANIEPDFLAKVKSVWVYRGIEVGAMFREIEEVAMILTNEDEVFAIGSNKCGQHGVGHTKPAPNPQKVPALSHKQVVDVSFGSGFALALTQDGTIYSWGKRNLFGQLGRETTNDGLIPKPIEGPLKGNSVKSFACGRGHSLALTDSGEVFAWGSNTFGQLGDGSQNCSKVPKKLWMPEGCHAQQISCGALFSIILLNDGRILSFGNSYYGQLGHGSKVDDSFPHIITALRGIKIVSVCCGYGHVLALSDEGLLFIWGKNNFGQLGNGSTHQSSVPAGNCDKRFAAIESTSHMSFAISESNQTYVWGWCDDAEILTPTKIHCRSLPEAFYFLSHKDYPMHLRAIRFTCSGTSESQPRPSTCFSQDDELVEQVKSLQLQLSATPNAVEATECKICHESHNGKPWGLAPCRHLGFCETCAIKLANESNDAANQPIGCPICRKKVVLTMQLYP